jgi:flagellin-like hook-associated protein FlgL
MIPFINAPGQVFLANLTQIENSNEKIQEEISSGLQINQASDAPDQITQLLQLQSQLAGNNQVQTNLNNVQAGALAADSSLTSVLQLTNQAASLGAEGADSTTTAQTRQQLAQQVQTIFDQVVSTSQTEVAGRYIFSGDDDQSPQYQVDPSSGNGVDQLTTALNTSQAQDTNGNTFPVGLTAAQIFDPRNSDNSYAPGNMFAALTSLYQSLNTNDTAGITSAIASLQTASAFVNTQQGFYGALENRITNSLNTAATQNTALTSQISAIQDTNFAEAATELTEGQTALQAALQAQSKVPTTSLFDFLG